MSKELIYKICIFGDRNVGKNELLRAYVPEMFNKQKKPPTCINIAIKSLIINSTKVSLQIWILGSELSFKFIFPAFTGGASGGIFMYDITKYSSLRNIEDWLIAFKESLSNDKKEIPILMVGGKLDLNKERVISRKYAENISKTYNIVKIFECSSKTGENIDKIFEFLTRSILKNYSNNLWNDAPVGVWIRSCVRLLINNVFRNSYSADWIPFKLSKYEKV